MFPTASRASHLPPTHWKDHAPGKVAPDAESVGQLGSIERDVELQPPIQILDAPCPHRESDQQHGGASKYIQRHALSVRKKDG